MSEEKPIYDKEFSQNLINQVFTNWVNPELKRREQIGRLPKGFILKAAQIILTVDGASEVRINGEVKARVEVKVKKAVEKGALVYHDDVEHIRSILLIDEEKDFGHITIFKVKDSWHIGFSFLYDSSKSDQFLKIAIRFLQTAKRDLKDGEMRSLVESLSVAMENLAKARIYLLPDKEIRKAKTHKTIKTRLNIHAKTSNIITSEQKDTFNKLLDLRDTARYDPNFSLEKKKASQFLGIVEKMKNEIQILIARIQ